MSTTSAIVTNPLQMITASVMIDNVIIDNDILNKEFLNENKIINHTNKKLLQDASENYTEIGWIPLPLGNKDKKGEGKALLVTN